MTPSGTQPQSWETELDELRSQLKGQVSGQSKVQVSTRTVAAKLNKLEAAVRTEIDRLEDARRRRVVGPRARVRAAIYTVEDSPRGPALTERRDSDARPFKCPKPVYDVVATVIAGAREPCSFQEIKANVSMHLQEMPANYAIRTPLRFWAAFALIEHEQARFFSYESQADFIKEARRAWRSAKEFGMEIPPS